MIISKHHSHRKIRDEIVSAYLKGDYTYEELGDYYKVAPATIRAWVCRYRKSGKIVSLQSQFQPVEDMSRKKKEPEASIDVSSLITRIRELEQQNLALNTLIDVAERNGLDIRKKSGAKQ